MSISTKFSKIKLAGYYISYAEYQHTYHTLETFEQYESRRLSEYYEIS